MDLARAPRRAARKKGSGVREWRPFCSAKLSIWIDSVNKFNSLLVERSVYIWDLETLQELLAEEANSIYICMEKF
jgi:hypothetical protein